MINILGAGSIGQLLAHKLTDASIKCQLIVRKLEDVPAKTWLLIDEVNSVQTKQEHTFSLSEPQDSSPLEILFVCVKAPDLKPALESIKHRLTPNSMLILFQNGMGHEKIAQHYVPLNHIFFASNTHGAFKSDRQTVHYAGKGKIDFGGYLQDSTADWFSDNLKQALDATWQPNMAHILWRKLMVNAVINPLTAIYNCNNGDLLTDDKKNSLLGLIDENKQFAKQLQLPFADDLKTIVYTVIEQTANNYSSMYQDVKAERITEINAINGYLLSQMEKHQFHSPRNWRLWSQFHIVYPPLQKQAQQKAQNFDELQYHVTQRKGTERPFTGTYYQHTEQGTYHCVCCNTLLFTDKEKFDSGCGWPSFDRAKNKKSIVYQVDTSHNMHRVEILCAQCGAHLGHVFDDGPTETGQRFCVNSVSLQFEQYNPEKDNP